MNQREAQALWNRLRGQLLGLDKTLKEIVDNRAWEPLGYSSFTECWKAEMAGVKLEGVMQVHAIYALYDSGATTEEIQVINGVGPEIAERAELAYSKQLAPADAERVIRVRSFTRTPARPQDRITIRNLKEDEILLIREIAEDQDTEYTELVKSWVLKEARKIERWKKANANA